MPKALILPEALIAAAEAPPLAASLAPAEAPASLAALLAAALGTPPAPDDGAGVAPLEHAVASNARIVKSAPARELGLRIGPPSRGRLRHARRPGRGCPRRPYRLEGRRRALLRTPCKRRSGSRPRLSPRAAAVRRRASRAVRGVRAPAVAQVPPCAGGRPMSAGSGRSRPPRNAHPSGPIRSRNRGPERRA